MPLPLPLLSLSLSLSLSLPLLSLLLPPLLPPLPLLSLLLLFFRRQFLKEIVILSEAKNLLSPVLALAFLTHNPQPTTHNPLSTTHYLPTTHATAASRPARGRNARTTSASPTEIISPCRNGCALKLHPKIASTKNTATK